LWLGVLAVVRLVGADYSLTMQLSAALVSQGDAVSVTCEIHQTAHDDRRQRDHAVAVSPPPTLLFVKKIRRNDSDDVDVKLASNHVVESLFQRSGRYRILHNHTDQLRRVRYTLKISSQYIYWPLAYTISGGLWRRAVGRRTDAVTLLLIRDNCICTSEYSK